MRVMFYLILFSLANCFTVFTKDETILESETLETKNVKEERDVYILTSNLNKDGLYLLLDAYRVKEEKSVNSIKEKYQENKDFKFFIIVSKSSTFIFFMSTSTSPIYCG